MDRYQFKFPSLYFLHIPKTAGTSLKWWLYDFYDPEDVLGIQLTEQLDQVSRQEINQARLITGHFGWRLFDHFDQPRLSITWLRDPVKRVISNFNYTREQLPVLIEAAKEVNRPEWITYYERCSQLSLHEMINSGMHQGYVDNLQTRHLANWFPEDEPRPVTEEVLEQAKKNLASMSFVGFSEWMTPSIDLCCFQLGFPYHPLRLKYNSTSSSEKKETPTLTAECKRQLESIEIFDRRLYDFAKARFQQQFAEFWSEVIASGADSVRQVSSTIQSNEAVAEIVEHYHPSGIENNIRWVINQRFHDFHPDIPLVDEGALDFIDTVLLDGWHPRWPGAEKGTVVRWAGPTNCSTVMFPLKPGNDYEVFFYLHNHAGKQLVENMTIYVNGTPVPSKATFADDARQKSIVWFLVPEGAIASNGRLTEVMFQISGEVPTSNVGEKLKMSFATTGFRYRVSSKDRLPIPFWSNNFESSISSTLSTGTSLTTQ